MKLPPSARNTVMLPQERSYERITVDDLRELQHIAMREREGFFYRNPHLKATYWNSLIAVALCQGAAKHFVDGKTGVKDFDIWYFYTENPNVKFPHRWRKQVDSKLQKFRTNPSDAKRGYRGRRIDLLGRSLVTHKQDAKGCIIEYLQVRRTKTAAELSKKPVVGLWPETILAETIWLGEL